MPIIILIFIAVFCFWFGERAPTHKPVRQGHSEVQSQMTIRAAASPESWEAHCRGHLASATAPFTEKVAEGRPGEITIRREGPNAPRFVEYTHSDSFGQYQILVSEEPRNPGERADWKSLNVIGDHGPEMQMVHHDNGVLSWVRATGPRAGMFAEAARAGVAGCEEQAP